MFGELSSVLEDSIESVSQLEDLKALLQYPSDPRPPDLNGKLLLVSNSFQ